MQKKRVGQERYRQLFSRILFVDAYGEEYCYDSTFMEDMIKKHIYTRWAHYGTLYGFCRYADATILLGSPEFLENNFRKVYYMMSILALFYRCALIDFANRSSNTTKGLIEEDNWTKNTDVTELRKAFLKFSNVWYFKELTNQDQGIEMFDMHRRAYELDELYIGVKEDIEKLDEYIRMEQAKKDSEAINRITKAGVPLGVMAVITGFWGMNLEKGLFKILTNTKFSDILNLQVDFKELSVSDTVFGLLTFFGIYFIFNAIKTFRSVEK